MSNVVLGTDVSDMFTNYGDFLLAPGFQLLNPDRTPASPIIGQGASLDDRSKSASALQIERDTTTNASAPSDPEVRIPVIPTRPPFPNVYFTSFDDSTGINGLAKLLASDRTSQKNAAVIKAISTVTNVAENKVTDDIDTYLNTMKGKIGTTETDNLTTLLASGRSVTDRPMAKAIMSDKPLYVIAAFVIAENELQAHRSELSSFDKVFPIILKLDETLSRINNLRPRK